MTITVVKFLPHTKVVWYCHYCLEELLLGGANGKYIAELLFPLSS